MSKPEVRYNNIVDDEKKIDPISKFFIITEFAVLGINRLSVFENIKPFYSLLTYIYSVIFTITYIVTTIKYVFWQYYAVVLVTEVIITLLIIVLSSVTWRRLYKYFIELSLLDKYDVVPNVKLSRDSKGSVLQLLLIVILLFVLYYIFSFYFIESVPWLTVLLVLIKLLDTVEYFFNGHLIALLVTRLQLISHCLETSYPIDQNMYSVDHHEQEIRISRSPINAKMHKIIYFYYSLIKAFDVLNDAVKWQLLFTFMKTFVVSLGDLHLLMTNIVSQKWNIRKVLISASITVVHFGSMFSVCAFGDKLHKEVLKLRDMLACRLYQCTLDKKDRRNAQALLTLTEVRNLSFSLFHMFNIDISLPFKIVGLLATYLIILLQFEKVNSDW